MDAMQVATENCEDADDFKAAIKGAFSPLLDGYSSAQLILFRPDETTEIDPGTSIAEFEKYGLGNWKSLTAKVEVAEPVKIPSKKKFTTYKEMSVEASCRKYFDALAFKLSTFYNFPWSNENFARIFIEDDLKKYPKRKFRAKLKWR
jgi:hypothetical protein